MAVNTPSGMDRGERVLAFMIAAVVGLSIIAIIVSMIVRAAGGEVWPVVVALPLVGLPIAFVLIIVRLVVTAVRRARESRDA
ncbi:hypothetical protein QT381_12005 [Galbitalea sp. SE-J8]|uniref:hypothetical protein n=1 Tax=Galbitalea sp. SE-J8 TaxID=3054952 RepID=UPI00259CEFC2|nr:hypothetical protein [Galbitalea sp. SE-J8]MDM4763732.1 hypothetical protein [Galbitalea sp. SE-J8]